jgi:hypothetical protein
MHVMGKSPRGREGGSQLVVDLLQKDLAAAKAQNHSLQAEVASLSEHSRRLAQDAEQQKGLLYEQMNAIQIELDACKRELDLAHTRGKALRAQTLGDAANSVRATSAFDDGEPRDVKDALRDEKGHGHASNLHPHVAPTQAWEAGGMDFEWMPAILAQLEGAASGRGPGDGSGQV